MKQKLHFLLVRRLRSVRFKYLLNFNKFFEAPPVAEKKTVACTFQLQQNMKKLSMRASIDKEISIIFFHLQMLFQIVGEF